MMLILKRCSLLFSAHRPNSFLLSALIVVTASQGIFANQYWWFSISLVLACWLLAADSWKKNLVCVGMCLIILGWFLTNIMINQMPVNQQNRYEGTISELHQNYVVIRIDFFRHLYLAQSDPTWKVGDRIVALGYVSHLIPDENSYEFDFSKYLQNNNVKYQLHLTDLRHYFVNQWYDRVEAYLFGSSDANVNSAFLRLFLLAENNEAVKKLYQNFVDMNLIHLLVISGYHINVLFIGIDRVLQKICHHRLTRVILIVIVLFGYLFFLNFKLTAFKAIALIIIGLSNKWVFHNRLTVVDQIALALLLTSLFYPFFFLQANVLYGFTITFGLAYWFSRIKHLNYFWKIVCVNLIIYALALGWNVYYNFQIDLTSILFNFLLMPIISIVYLSLWVIVWIAPLHCVCQYFYVFLFNYTELLLKINIIFHIGQFGLWLVALYYILLTICWKWHHKWHFINFFTCVLLFVLCNFGLWINQPLYSVTMLDVGNANSIVIQDFAHWTTVLFDAGSGRGYSKHLMSDYLKSIGVNYISEVFISHYHADHYNNYVNVQNQFWIKHTADNNASFKTLTINDMNFFIFNNNWRHSSDENDNSLVVLLKLASLKILLTGDATALVEQDLVKHPLLRNIDLLQVAHHGSSTSSSPFFINYIKPKVCFISGKNDGVENFPTAQTMSTLQENHCAIYQTNEAHNLQFVVRRNYFFEIHTF